MNEQTLTIQDAAKFLGVSKTTLRRWEERNVLLPMRTAGNQRRYALSQLQAFKDNGFKSLVAAGQVAEEPAITQPPTPIQEPTLAEAAFISQAPTFSTPAPQPVAPQQPEPFVSQLQNEANVQVSAPEKPFNAALGFQLPNNEGKSRMRFLQQYSAAFAAAVVVLAFFIAAAYAQSWGSSMDSFKRGLAGSTSSNPQVLAANDNTPIYELRISVPAVFGKKATFLDSAEVRKSLTVNGESVLTGGIRTENADIDAGNGRITASNVIYSLTSGANISITGDPQNPVISANVGEGLVTSFQGLSGALTLAEGSGIGLDGLTITNTGVLSLQGQTGALSFSQGAGITLNGMTITNSDPGTAQKIFGTFRIGATDIAADSNTDTFTFAAGSGITLTPDAAGKKLTIDAAGASSQWSTVGSDIYYSSGDVGIGNTAPASTLDVTGTGRFTGGLTISSLGAGVVKADALGVLSSSALDLASGEVTGILPVTNGGTGLSSVPTNGQLLIGNGTNYTLGNLTGTTNQISISNGAGSITFSTPQDIHTAASPTFATLNLSSDTNQIYLGSGTTGRISMDPLTANRFYTFPDASGTVCLTSGNCSGGGGGGIAGFGTTNYIAKFTSSSGISDSSIFDNGKIGIGTTSPEGLLTVSGGPAGKALAVFNYTGSGQDILTASASGTTRLVLTSNGTLNIIGGAYQIGGVNVISSDTLGSGIINSSLTSVGSLASGSIATTFGNIDVGTDSISGGDITATGANGFAATGNGADLLFSGMGNHDITASGGTLRLGAATLLGAITGNNQNITGLNNLSAGGSITFGGLGQGVVQSDGSGVLSSGALNLSGGASYVSGVLSAANGGTGISSYSTGDLLFASAGNTLSALPIGTEGQLLGVTGSGTPGWIEASALNFWTRNNGALSPVELTNDLLIGGNATSSAKFQVFGMTGNATTSGTFTFDTAGSIRTTRNQSLTIGGNTTGNIILSPLNGSGTVTSTGDVDLAIGKVYRIDGANVLTANALGTGVVSSSLTSVGALTSGSIGNGFGAINIGNTITGTTVTGTTVNATTGVNTGASGGTQRIDSSGNLVNIGTTQFNGITYTWPAADDNADYILRSDGNGGLSWVNATSLPNVGDINAIGDVTSGAAFTASGTQGTSLYFYDADGRGQLTIANLTQARTYTLPDASGTICLTSGNCAGSGGGITGSGTSGQMAFFNGAGTITSETSGFRWDASTKRFGIGTDTPDGKLSVSGASAGQALVVFNETGDQDIFTASASGATQFTIGRNGNIAVEGQLSDLSQDTLTINDNLNLTTGGIFRINGTDVLSASALGSNVVSSSLTSVGALSSGSIANGFGSIFTSNTIQGSNITASGTTGFTASGNGAGLTFSGTGNHIISASSGTLQIGAATLTGELTGNSQNIVGINNFSASGTVTFGGLSEGVLKSDSSGVISSSAVGLGSTDVTGTLGVGNGGTGITSVGSAGAVAYSNGSTYAFTSAGTSGYVLSSNGSSAPSWVDPSTLGTNYLQRNGGLLAPKAITDDLAIGGTSTSSAKFQIFGQTGNATTSGTLTFNTAGNIQTTNNQTLTFGGSSTGNIVFSPLNGAGTVIVNGDMNLSSGNAFTINGIDVLSATTLGTNVVTSSLTTVGELTSGSIASGFGTIETSNTITGSTINGTTGISTGAGAGTQRIDNSGNLVNIGTTEFNGVTYSWPGADGDSDYVLTTDSDGNLTWKNVTSVGGAGDITAIGDVTSGAAFTSSGTQGTSLYFYDTDGRGQLTTANLTQARTYTLPNASGTICLVEAGNCAGAGGGITGSGTAGQISFFDDTNSVTSEASGFAWDATNNRLGIGNDSPTGKLDVTGGNTGKALVVFNETGDQDIFTASASGVTQIVLNRNGNLAIEGQLSDISQDAVTVNDDLNLTAGNEFQINGTTVLSSSALGANVVSSSLTSVGALTSGSIANGFGSILTGSTIQGSDITASGTTGFTASGNGAGLTFSGTGNHIISASSGTLQIGAATLTGAITGNNQNITGVNNFGAGGTITFGGLSTGIVKSNSSGQLSSSAVGLNTSDVTGTLAVGNGGTGQTSFTSNGVVYGNGSNGLNVTSAPTGGQVLLGNNSGVPTFTTLSGGVTISDTGVTSISLSSSSDTSTTSSNSGLEFSTSNGLSLLRGCANNEILKWDDTSKVWSCGIDQGGAGAAGTINVQNNDVGVGSNVDTIDFGTDFSVTASPSNEANVAIADDILDFTEFTDNMTLDASTSFALSNFNLTLGTNAGTGNVVVSPNAGGNSALIVNKQGTGDIFTASASGTTRLTLSSSGNLNIVGGSFQIGGTSVLSNDTLGSGVVNSSLTSVGALDGGSITSNFGSIDVGTDAISGGNITASGGTGFTASGNGAGLSFSGTGNHLISATAGTLQLGAATLLGTITGNGQDLTGLDALSASGTITFGGFSTNGGLLYTNGTGQVAQLSSGTLGQCLQSNGANAPVWGSCAAGATNYWNQANGAISPFNGTVDLLVGGSSSSSAKFAVLNVNNGTPTASVSAGTNGAAYLTAAGNLQTTANQTLTLGGDTTGNVVISPQNGSGSLYVTGLANCDSIDTDGNGRLVCGSDAGGSGGSAGIVNIQNNETGVGTDVNTIDFGTDFSVTADPSSEANVAIADDVINFSEVADSMSLDAATNVAFGNFNFTLGTNAGTGGLIVAPNAGGNSALIVNKQGIGDIFTASASGTTRLTLNSSGDLNIVGGAYQIGGNTVLTGTTLGTNVVTSSLTTVGALNSGSITNGFGAIDTGTDAISGGNITASGGTGFTASGNGAGLTFSGTGNHDIAATGGVLRLGATTLNGAITGNSQDITGLDALSASGTITFGGFSTNGGLLYTNGSGQLAQLSAGTSGQALVSGGTGAPTWTTGTLTLAGNFATSGTSSLTLTTTGATNVTLPTTGTLATLAGTETFSNKTLTAPRFADLGFLADSNGNEFLILDSVASAVNELTLGNAATGNPVTLSATGDDANIALALDAKGTGELRLNGTGTGNILLGGGSGSTGCTVTNSNGNFACAGNISATGTISGSNFSGSSSGTNTGDQTITLTGDVSGTGTGSFATTIQDNSVDGTDIALGSDAQGDLMYYNGTDWVRLAAGTGNQLLHSGNTPSWGAVDLTNQITGTLAVGNGGTGATSLTQGGVLYGNGTSAVAASAQGTAGQALVSGGTGAPTWTTGTLTLAGNFATSGTSALTLTTTGATNVTLPTTGTLATLAGTETFTNKTLTAPRFADLGFLADSNGNEFLILDSVASAVNQLQIANSASGNAVAISATGDDTNIPLTIDAKGTGELRLNGTGTGNILLGGGSSSTGCTVTNSTGAFACTGALSGSNFTGTSSGTNTGDQTITLTGDVSGSGTGSFATTIADNSVDGTDIALGSDAQGDLMYYDGNNWVRLAAGTGNQLLHSGTTPSWGAVDLTTQITGTLPIANGGTNSTATPTQGGIAYGTGTAFAFTSAGTGGQCLQSNGTAAPTWGNCADGSINYWNQANGAISPFNGTVDLLVGGSSSSSAKFAVLNVNNGTPTASVSAGTNGAAYLTAAGALQTTANQTLTLGGSTTGNIILDEITRIGSNTTGLNITTDGVISDLDDSSVAISESLSVTGTITSTGNITNGGFDFVLGSNDQASRGNSGTSRALVKDEGNILTINYGGDFTGGTSIQSNLGVTGTGGLTLSGNDADITFSGTGTHAITASGGTLQLGAATLGGAITGNSQNITGLGQLGVDNLTLDGSTISGSADITLDATGGNILVADGDALNVGGAGAQAYNFFAGSTTNNSTADGDNDLYIEGELEVDGATRFDGDVTVSTFNSVKTSLPANTVVYQDATSLAQSPIAGSLWHDLLAFNKKDTPDFEQYNGSWVAGALNNNLFAQKEDQTIQVLNGTTTTGARWTWNNMEWSQGQWMVLGFNYTSPAASKNITVESSSDGSVWTTRHTSTGITTVAEPVWFNVSSYNGDSFVRLTIESTNSEPVELSTIRLLSPRWGDQGDGSENSFPYVWDGDQDIAFGAGAAVGNGIVTIGTNTTAASGGLYFGTDTNLYRSAANTLRTDDAFNVNGTFNVSTAGAISGATGLSTSGTVTFSALNTGGGILYTNGSGTVAQTTAGTAGQCLVSSGGTAPTWGACGGTNVWAETQGAVTTYSSTMDLLLGSNASSSAKFAVLNMTGSGTPTASVSATSTGNGIAIAGNGSIQSLRNNTLTIGGNTTGNITLSPLSGSGTVTSTGNLNLSSGKVLQINGTEILSATALGAGVTSSSLDSVDQLNSGSITDGFGSIDVGTDAISGGTVTATSTTGFAANGVGAGLNFSGTGTHTIQASAGVLQINAFTMGGAITGGGNNITGLGQLAVDNLDLNGNTFSSTTGDITLNAADGDIIFADTDTLNIGGNATDVAYNVIGDSTSSANGTNMTSDDDLYVEGNVEVDGTVYLSAVNAGGSAGVTISTGSCVTTNNGIVIGSAVCETGADTWTLATGGIVHTSNQTTDVLIGGTSSASAKVKFSPSGTSPTASISGRTAQAALIVDNQGTGDLLTASSSGLPRFTIKNNGKVIIGREFTSSNNNELLTLKNVAGANTDFTLEDGSGVNRWSWFANTSGSTGFYDASNGLSPFTIEEGAPNSSLYVDSTGNIGLGVANAGSALELSSGDNIQLNSGQIQDYGDLTFKLDSDNNSTNDFEVYNGASSSVFKVEETGLVTIGNTTNGFTFDPATGPTYYGTARPTASMVISAEYPGAVLTASGSASTNGFMTSDASTSAALSFMNYYEWNSSQTSQQDYTVAVRVTLPSDFGAWATSNAIVIDYNTELSSSTRSKFDLLVRREGEGTPTAFRQNNTSPAGQDRTWTTLVIDDSDLTDGAAAAQWSAADQTAVFYIKMSSRDNNHVQVGDITLNYLRRR